MEAPEKQKHEKSAAYMTFRDYISKMSVKDKVLSVLQIVLSIVIIVIAILGLNNIGNTYVNNMVDMGLLVGLLVVSSIKLFSSRKVYATMYIVIALAVVFIMINSLSHH